MMTGDRTVCLEQDLREMRRAGRIPEIGGATSRSSTAVTKSGSHTFSVGYAVGALASRRFGRFEPRLVMTGALVLGVSAPWAWG